MSQKKFEEELVAFLPELKKFIYSRCRNVDLADDLVQQTALRALSCRESFDGRNMAAWLTTIAKNEFFTNIRKNKRYVADPDNYQAQRTAVPCDQLDNMIAQEALKIVDSLPSNWRAPLLMQTYDDASLEEIARELRIPEGTVKSRIHRARQALEGIR